MRGRRRRSTYRLGRRPRGLRGAGRPRARRAADRRPRRHRRVVAVPARRASGPLPADRIRQPRSGADADARSSGHRGGDGRRRRRGPRGARHPVRPRGGLLGRQHHRPGAGAAPPRAGRRARHGHPPAARPQGRRADPRRPLRGAGGGGPPALPGGPRRVERPRGQVLARGRGTELIWPGSDIQEGSQMAATETAAAARDALVERLFEGVLGMTDVYTVYMGDRLGIYGVLAEGKDSEEEIAEATSINRRYLREWLEQQAVTGIIEVDDPSRPPEERRYRLPEGYHEVLVDRDSPAYMAAFARMMAGIARPLPRVLEAFRSGAGIPYADFDPDFLEGQGEMNRVQFVNFLASDWMPGLPDVHERLQSGGRVADVACGTGWSTIALARAYPQAEVHGLDLDEASIELASENAAREGMDVPFEVRDAADPGLSGRYDLVTCFEAVHDMARPVDSLRGMRSLLADGGVLLIADERVAEEFTAPGDEVERVMYGFSVFHCLAVGREEQPSAATGTAMRVGTLRGYAEEAGFARFEVLPIENDFWRFYRLEG